MTVSRMITMICDFCSTSADESFHTVKEAKADAKKDGWKLGKEDFCVTCVQSMPTYVTRRINYCGTLNGSFECCLATGHEKAHETNPVSVGVDYKYYTFADSYSAVMIRSV